MTRRSSRILSPSQIVTQIPMADGEDGIRTSAAERRWTPMGRKVIGLAAAGRHPSLEPINLVGRIPWNIDRRSRSKCTGRGIDLR